MSLPTLPKVLVQDILNRSQSVYPNNTVDINLRWEDLEDGDDHDVAEFICEVEINLDRRIDERWKAAKRRVIERFADDPNWFQPSELRNILNNTVNHRVFGFNNDSVFSLHAGQNVGLMDETDFIEMQICVKYVRVPNIDVYIPTEEMMLEGKRMMCHLLAETFRRIFPEAAKFKLKDQSMLQLNYWNQVVEIRHQDQHRDWDAITPTVTFTVVDNRKMPITAGTEPYMLHKLKF